jgi:U3 small nucleolar RNA-associated protein 12
MKPMYLLTFSPCVNTNIYIHICIVDIAFLGDSHIVTCSKDTLLKVWDLETQHCIQTVVGHRAEVWSLDIDDMDNPKYLITGSVDNVLRIYKVSLSGGAPNIAVASVEAEAVNKEDVVFYWSSVGRQTNERVGSIKYSSDGKLVAIQAAGKTLELYRIRNEEEIQKKVSRRKKRAREKARKDGTDEAAAEGEVPGPQGSDMMELLTVIRAGQKISSFDFQRVATSENQVTMILSLANNSVSCYTVDVTEGVATGTAPATKEGSLSLGGHRSDIRSVALSSDDSLIVSTSADSCKIWNSRTQECIRTVETGFALCALFCPGDKHVVVGLKSGALLLIDISSAEVIQNIEDAHTGALWSMALRPDCRGIVTGSADKDVKFWDFEFVTPKEGTGKKLALVHTRTLKMSDDVLCVRFSKTRDPTKLLLAVSLLDSTVKVFYEDTLKFFLSLYGHKLPVMALDISSDNTLLVTASADKNVKLWGLDFGDCHKSLFAHGDSIMSVAFVPNTHYFFTASKDRLVKYWDADKFENILTLDAHFGEVWSLAVSSLGDFLVTGSSDRSLRLWERTEEQVFIEEERERELENMFEADLNAPEFDHGAAPDTKENAAAGQRSLMTIKSSERIIEALQLADEEEAISIEHNRATLAARAGDIKSTVVVARPLPSVQLLGKTPVMHILATLKYINPSDLEESLIVLPFDSVVKLLEYLEALVDSGESIELVSRCIFFLLKVHHKAIVSNRILLMTLDRLRSNTRKQVRIHRDRMGFNMAGLKFLNSAIVSNSSVMEDVTSFSNNENDGERASKRQKKSK